MAVNYTSARFSAEDDNGRPLVGGRLFTYQNGTTTPAVTYKNDAGTTPNTNPIILDARGEAVVYLQDTQVYTFVLQNRFGSLIWSQDGISGNASSSEFLQFTTNLRGTTGASLIGIKQRGTGAVARTVGDKINDGSYTFEDYGAIGDGIVDDTAALQAAIRASWTLGVEITASAGKKYRYTQALQLVDQASSPGAPRSARVRGAGSEVCFLVPEGTFDAVRAWGLDFVGGGGGSAFGVEFGGFTIDARGLTGNILDNRRVGINSKFYDIKGFGATGVGLYARSVFDHTYRDVEMRGCTSYGAHIYETKDGVDPEGFEECSFLHFDNVHVLSNNGRDVQWLVDGGDKYTFISCKPSEGKVGFDFINGSTGHIMIGTYVDGQTVTAFDNVGIRIGTDCFNNSVIGGRFWNCRFGVDFVAGGRTCVMGTNIVYNSPIGANVFDVRMGAGVQQPVDVGAGLAISGPLALARIGLRYATNTWTPGIYSDGGQVGAFNYTTRYGRYEIIGNTVFIRYALAWNAKPSAGNGFGVDLPFPFSTGVVTPEALRTKPAVMTVTGFDTMGFFSIGTTQKLYITAGAGTISATAAAFPDVGSIVGEARFFLE